MRALLIPSLIVALLGSTSAVASESAAPDYSNIRKFEPVYVQVNAQGKITEINPAYPLSDGLKRLLRANLNEMIHTPAIGKDGKPVPSQFIITVALKVEPLSTGDYDAEFTYVSSIPLPSRDCSWVRGIKGQVATCGSGQVLGPNPYANASISDAVPVIGSGFSSGGNVASSSGGRSR